MTTADSCACVWSWQSIYVAEAADTVDRLMTLVREFDRPATAKTKADIDALVEELAGKFGAGGIGQYRRPQHQLADNDADRTPLRLEREARNRESGEASHNFIVPDSSRKISQTPGMTPLTAASTGPQSQRHVGDGDASPCDAVNESQSPTQQEKQRILRRQLLAAEGCGGSVLRHAGNQNKAGEETAAVNPENETLRWDDQQLRDSGEYTEASEDEEDPSLTEQHRQDRRRKLLAAAGGGGSVMRSKLPLQRAVTDPGPVVACETVSPTERRNRCAR